MKKYTPPCYLNAKRPLTKEILTNLPELFFEKDKYYSTDSNRRKFLNYYLYINYKFKYNIMAFMRIDNNRMLIHYTDLPFTFSERQKIKWNDALERNEKVS